MSASEPPEPPGGGVPREVSGPVSGWVPSASGPVPSTRSVGRRIARWAFPVFVVIVLVLAREVLLPFVFAGLIAYILAPPVRWICERKDGTRRMPRGLAIVMCYIVFLAAVTGFMFLLVPRLGSDVRRLIDEASYKRINEEYTPQLARWLEHHFPSLAGKRTVPDEPPVLPDGPPLPPGTAFTMTPLPDGRFAMALTPNGLDVHPTPDGGFHLQAIETAPEPTTLEDKLRTLVKKGLIGLQSQLDGVLRFGQSLIAGFIRGIFMFFFTLMIGAFILIDVEKVHGFLRSLFPGNVRDDYDVIMQGIDRGLSGVIRGQLVICLINGCLTYAGLLVFGVKYGIILAMVAGAMSLVPIFGSILSSVPIVLVALVSGDQGIDVFRGVAMLLWIIGIHFLEANLLNPKIIGTAAKIHPVLVIFALFFGEASYGLVGALLAVPLLSAIQVVFVFLYKKTWKDHPRRAVEPLPPTQS